MKNIVLDSTEISNKLKRISFEIIEKNLSEKQIVLLGILPNGKFLTDKIKSHILKNSKIQTSVFYLDIDKNNFFIKKISPDFNKEIIKEKVVILIDDVMNSAATLMYSINKILEFSPKEIQIAVLIERYYKNFPLVPNFKGLELSTSKSEHVKVKLDKFPKVIIL